MCNIQSKMIAGEFANSDNANQKDDYLNETNNSLRAGHPMEKSASGMFISLLNTSATLLRCSRLTIGTIAGCDDVFQDPEKIIKGLRSEGANFQHEIDDIMEALRVYQHKHRCETLLADGHAIDAAKSLLEITRSVSNDSVKSDIIDWLSGELAQQRC